jgi:predicted DNA repair protein MutK
MPYREKVAWLTLIATLVGFGPYFFMLAADILPRDTASIFRQLAWYAVAVIVNLTVLGIGHLYLRWQSAGEWRIPPDERDRAIQQRSMTAAYYVLMTGALLVGCFMPFATGGMRIVTATLFAVIFAEVVRHCLMVASYRMQA